VPSAQVIEDDLIVGRNERLTQTLAALDARLLADFAHPLVTARRGIARGPFPLVHPASGKEARSAPKQRTEQLDLVARAARRSNLCLGAPPTFGLDLRAQSRDPLARARALAIERREALLLACQLPAQVVRDAVAHRGARPPPLPPLQGSPGSRTRSSSRT
jgi:hypothetical protein